MLSFEVFNEIVSLLGGDCLDMTLEMMLAVGLSTVLQ